MTEYNATEEEQLLTNEELAALPIEELIARNACVVCLRVLDAGAIGNFIGSGLAWTDTHGIARHRCGATYIILHYENDDENKSRAFNVPPEFTGIPELLLLMRRFWQETHSIVSPGAYCFPGSSYSNDTDENVETWNSWMTAHNTEYEAAIRAFEARRDAVLS